MIQFYRRTSERMIKMNKKAIKLLAAGLTAAMLLAGCSENSGGSNTVNTPPDFK